MIEHVFLFSSGIWMGEGSIRFSESEEMVHFYTKWQIGPLREGFIFCTQIVEMEGEMQQLQNRFTLSAVQGDSFTMQIENDLMGKVQGKGVIDPDKIAWEFRDSPRLDGFEVYKKQEDGTYQFHAEYASEETYRTIINGRLWAKK